MKVNPYKLKEKGMSPQEIDQISRVINHAQSKKSRKIRFLDSFSYWALLGIAILGNALVSFTLAPIIIITSNVNLYLVLIVLGAALGVLFSTVVKNLEIEIHHHTLIMFLVPTMAFVSFFIITSVTNAIAIYFNISIQNSPAMVSIFYLIAFIAPYLNYLFSAYIKQHHRESKQKV